MNHGRQNSLNVENHLFVPRLFLYWLGSMQSFKKEETIFLRYDFSFLNTELANFEVFLIPIVLRVPYGGSTYGNLLKFLLSHVSLKFCVHQN